MSVHEVQRKTGRAWKVSYRTGGRQRTKTFGRKKDATEFDARMKIAKQRGSMGPAAGDLTVSELADRWMRTHVIPNLRPQTAQVYATVYDQHIGPYLGRLKLNEFGTFQVAEFQSALYARAPYETASKTMTALSGMFTKGTEWGIVDVNPVRQVKRPPAPVKEPVTPISPRQVEEAIAWFRDEGRDQDAVMIAVLAYAGLRPGEVRALRWKDIGERSITVWQAVSGDELRPTKTGGSRSVTLLAPLRADLLEYRLLCGRPPDEAFVFPKADGSFLLLEDWKNWQVRWFTKMAKQVGLPWTSPYNLRHSFASLLIHSDLPVVQISQQLGHSTEMLLSTYAHVISEYANAPKVVPEEEIWAARAGGVSHLLPAHLPQAVGEGRFARGNGKPSIGLEPMTPSLPWKCSTN